VLDTLDVGEVSHPSGVDLLDGSPAYHFVLLQRKTTPHRLSIDEDYVLLSQYALQDKRRRERDEWVRQLREQTYVDIRTDRYQPAGRG
jgi:peptidyl-prolyl cis-trans isomerase SurA